MNSECNYVYRITHIPTGQHYIGSRKSQGLPAHQDLGKRYFTSSKVVRSLFKSNPAAFKMKILKICPTRYAALVVERHYHLRLQVNTNPKFFNQVIAGEKFVGGPKTDEHRKHLSESTSARRLDVREKMRQAKLSNPTRYWLGKSRSKETKAKIRAALIGNTHSEETKMLLRRINSGAGNGFYGKTHSEDSRKKMSVATQGRKSFQGKTHSEEARRKMSEARKRYWRNRNAEE